MPDVPYPLASDDEKEFLDNTMKLMRDLTEQRIGAASIGDVFSSPGDVITLKIAENSGLFKNANGQLDINVSADCISNNPSGGIESTTLQNAINELDGDKISKDGTGNCYIGTMQVLGISGGTPPDYAAVIVPQLNAGNCVMFSYNWYNGLTILLPSGSQKTYDG